MIVSLQKLFPQIYSDHKKQSGNKVKENLSFNIFNSNIKQDQSTTGMNGQFVHSQLLIDCLLRMKSTAVVKNELIGIHRKEHESNTA